MDFAALSGETEILPLGQDAVLVRFSLSSADIITGAVQAFRNAVEQSGIRGIVDVTGSLNSVLVRFDPKMAARDDVTAALSESITSRDWLKTPPPEPVRRWTVPVAFGGTYGPQLAEAAELAGVSQARAVAEMTEADLRVLAIGFAPGQPYLGTLTENWNIARQSHLTPQVPAGAIAVAVRQIVLFTNASKTGWRLIGRTGFRPFKKDRSEPFLLQQGDALRFTQVPDADLHDLLENAPDGLGGARCEVLQ